MNKIDIEKLQKMCPNSYRKDNGTFVWALNNGVMIGQTIEEIIEEKINIENKFGNFLLKNYNDKLDYLDSIKFKFPFSKRNKGL